MPKSCCYSRKKKRNKRTQEQSVQLMRTDPEQSIHMSVMRDQPQELLHSPDVQIKASESRLHRGQHQATEASEAAEAKAEAAANYLVWSVISL